jgi:hypothetical protein
MVNEFVIMVALKDELVVHVVLSEKLNIYSSRSHYKNNQKSEDKRL